MEEIRFKHFLEEQGATPNGVKSRISKGKRIERELGVDLDSLVASDEKMFEALSRVLPFEDKRNNMQNVLRKYYIFKHGKEFPKKNDYRG